MSGKQIDPRFSCLVPGSVAVQLRNPIAPRVESRATGSIVVRNASLGGLSAVFLDLRVEDGPGDSMASWEPKRDVLAAIELEVAGSRVQFLAAVVWYRRHPATHAIAVTGLKIVADSFSPADREVWAGWIAVNTRGLAPMEAASGWPVSTRAMLEEVDVRVPVILAPPPPLPSEVLDAAEAPNTPRARASVRTYLEMLRRRAGA